MHVRELVEVAGIVALNGPLIMGRAAALAPAQLEQYWATSKCRFENWHRALKCHGARADGHADEDPDGRVDRRAVLDEVFVSEMLTRVWSAVVVGQDQRRETRSDAPVARNVMLSHMEARHRALGLLLDGPRFDRGELLAINRLRRRVERWTDVLIGGLLGAADVREFAVDPGRALDFADDLARRRAEAGGRQAWRLTLVSLRAAFEKGLCPLAANPQANGRIAASILGCLPGELFDSTGVFRSLWMMRLSAVASDAQGLIDDLLENEPRREATSRSTLPRRRPR